MSPALPSRSVAEPTREALLDLAPSRAAPAPDLGEADLALSETDPSSRPRWTRSASSVLAWMFLAASLAILALTAITRRGRAHAVRRGPGDACGYYMDMDMGVCVCARVRVRGCAWRGREGGVRGG